MNLGKKLRNLVAQDDYWHGTRKVGPAFEPGRLDGYPNDLSAKTQKFEGPVNELGVPLVDSGSPTGPFMHPVTLCQVALGWHERAVVERSEVCLGNFLRLARWLVDNQQPWQGGRAWPVPVAKPLYRVEAPWVSALVQGQAISVLARAARHSRDGKYIDAMEGAFALFELDVSRGGVRTEDEYGVAFEEYPSPTPSIVLNGLISSLWGLSDMSVAQPAGSAGTLFHAGVRALLSRLHRYDLGFWSRYCLYDYVLPNVASPYYHREHLAQLEAMNRLVPDERWIKTRLRWQQYQDSRVARGAALAAKVAWRLSTRLRMNLQARSS